MFRELGFIKLAKGEETMMSSSSSMALKPGPVKIPEVARSSMLNINKSLMTKKDNPPVWEKPVEAVFKDVSKYKKTHGDVKNYFKDRVKEVTNIVKENPKGALATAVAAPTAYFAARNNPKLRQAIEAVTSRKISYHKKGKGNYNRTSFQYNFPKGKGDWGRLSLKMRF